MSVKDILFMVVIVSIVSAVGFYVRDQAKRLENQAVELGELHMINANQAEAITELRTSKKSDDDLVATTANKLDTLATRIQSLDRRTQEALRNAPNLTLDSVLPPAAADALCLQWHEASGRGAADNLGNPAPGPDARAGDTAAAGRRTTPDCRGWRKMTVRSAVEWNGLLLKHAGLEREDKAALRTRVEKRIR